MSAYFSNRTHKALFIVMAGLLSTAADAQERNPGQGLEEIIVTAQKREESIQSAPISIVAFSGKMLEARGITNLADLAADVPSLSISPHPQSGSTLRTFIRGLGIVNDQITYDPSVAIYLDGVYVARFQGLATEVADLERIEVLRGPQGALYGRNSTGGAINFITAAPKLDEFGFRQDFSVGNYDSFRSRTYVNLPVGETFAVDLSYLRASKNGFVRNLGTGVSRFGDQDRRAYRVAALWSPIDRLNIRYTYDRSELEDTPNFVGQVPLYSSRASRPKVGSPAERNLRANDVVGWGHNLTASLEVNDTLSLRSITAYRDLDSFVNRAYHTGLYGVPISAWDLNVSQHQFSEELQAIGTMLDSRLEYVAGLYWFDEKSAAVEIGLQPLANRRTDRNLSANNTAYAAFGQATYTPNVLDQRLHLTVGARWSRDKREATKVDAPSLISNGTPLPIAAGDAKRRYSDFSPSAVIAFDASDNVNLYAKVATGYKTGGFNLSSSSIATFQAGFGPESVTSYELGVKSNWLNNTLRVNAALFTARYDDLQLSINPIPSNTTITDVLNAGKASVDGLELDIAMRPVPELNLSLAYAWLDAGYDSIKDSGGNNIAYKFGFVEAPKNKLSTSIEYTFANTVIGTPSVMLTYAYQSERISSTSCPKCVIGSYGLLDARMSLADIPVGNRSKLRFSLWGKNLLDEDYYTMHVMVLVPSAVFGDPRSYGADVTFEY